MNKPESIGSFGNPIPSCQTLDFVPENEEFDAISVINPRITSNNIEIPLNINKPEQKSFDSVGSAANEILFGLSPPSQEDLIEQTVTSLFHHIINSIPDSELSKFTEESADRTKANLYQRLKGVSLENPDFEIPDETDAHAPLFKGTLINPNDDDGIEIFKKIKFIAQGTFAKVYLYQQINTEKQIATKVAIPKVGKTLEEARNELQNDIKYLNLYNEDGKVTGIMPDPYKVSFDEEISYADMCYRPVNGMEIYEMKEEMQLSPDEEDRFYHKVIDDLSAGLEHIIQKGMFHGDTKPQNILSNRPTSVDNLKICHNDFGGDRSFADIVNQLDDLDNCPTDYTLFLPTFTTNYTSKEIVNDIMQLVNGAKAAQIDALQAKKEIEKKLIEMTKFSLGVTLCVICTNSWPVEIPAFISTNIGFLFGDGSSVEEDLKVLMNEMAWLDNDSQNKIKTLLGINV